MVRHSTCNPAEVSPSHHEGLKIDEHLQEMGLEVGERLVPVSGRGLSKSNVYI